MKEDSNHSNRRLAAIMFTDMVGYSQLMQKNEAAALKLLEKQWEIVEPILQEFGGKRIKTIGDAFYTQFHSVLKALNCALAVQRRLSRYNATRHFEKHITLRIGIHLGDVEIKDGDAYGDGVNIAARIESLAKPGGIAITEDVHRQVVNKVDHSFKPLGKPTLKNIQQRFEVYQVILPWHDRRKKQDPNFSAEKDRRRRSRMRAETPKVAHQKQQSTNRSIIYGGLAVVIIMAAVFLYRNSLSSVNKERGRSIAVLPFENMTAGTGSDYFSDGITEDIISKLSEIKDLRVIARTSVLQYKKTTKSVLDIANELEVNTILEGSIRRIENKVRVVAQLIDIRTDDHLWAGTYDRNLDDIFAVQSDIARNIATALQSKLTPSEEKNILDNPTVNTKAYEYYREGLTKYYTYSFDGFNDAIKNYNNALNIDPNYALVYAELANAYGQLFIINQEQEYLEKGFSSVDKALTIQTDLAEAYKAKALLEYAQSNGMKSLENNIKATELKPGYYDAIANVGNTYTELGDLSEALRWQEKSYHLNPYSLQADWHLAQALFMLEENEKAMESVIKGIQKFSQGFRCPSILFHHRMNEGELNRAEKILIDLEKVRKSDDSIHDLWIIYYFISGDIEKALESTKNTPFPTDYSKLYHAGIHAKAGNIPQSEKILSEIESRMEKRLRKGSDIYRPYYMLAQIHAIRGNNDSVFSMLDQAVDNGFRGYGDDINFLSWQVNPIFSDLRQNSRFIMLQKRVEKIIQQERAEAGLLAQAS